MMLRMPGTMTPILVCVAQESHYCLSYTAVLLYLLSLANRFRSTSESVPFGRLTNHGRSGEFSTNEESSFVSRAPLRLDTAWGEARDERRATRRQLSSSD